MSLLLSLTYWPWIIFLKNKVVNLNHLMKMANQMISMGGQYIRRRGGRGGRSAIWMTNYAFIDGAVRGIRNIGYLDSRLDWVHVTNGANGYKAPMPSVD